MAGIMCVIVSEIVSPLLEFLLLKFLYGKFFFGLHFQ